MFFTNSNFDKKRNVPISHNAFIDIINLDYFLPILIFVLFVVVAGFGGMFLGDLIYWIAYGLTTSLLLFLLLYKRHQDLEKIKIANYEDYQKALKIEAFFEKFQKKIPEIIEVLNPKKVEEEGWRPKKVTFFSDQTIDAKVSGSFSGDWNGFFAGSFKGTLTGDIKGDIKQNLINQGVIVILGKGDNVLRLVSLNSEICKKALFNTLTKYYSPFTFSGQMIYDCLSEFFEKWDFNASNVFDRIENSLEKPFEERPIVAVKGISLGFGVVGAYSVALDGEPFKVVFPAELVSLLLGEVKKL